AALAREATTLRGLGTRLSSVTWRADGLVSVQAEPGDPAPQQETPRMLSGLSLSEIGRRVLASVTEETVASGRVLPDSPGYDRTGLDPVVPPEVDRHLHR
ncbi:MAG: hypothetical protein KIT69_06655, partial [Propionibacteriaceae bacterium]|nr:hypothetical protein [Propionibacteriaceae bacterium]